MMQTDVLASAQRSTSGQMLDQAGNTIGKARVKAIYAYSAGTNDSIILSDGGASGPAKVSFIVPAGIPVYQLLPGEGLLFSTNVYYTTVAGGIIVLFYG